METAEIWVYGDPDFLSAVLTGVAHVFAQDVFLYSVAIGFIVNLLWSIFQWLSAPQKNALFSTLLQSIIIYAILFSPHMNVVLRSPSDNASTQISGSIPWGIAVPASLMSTMGNAWREEFRDTAYAGLPVMSNASLLFQTEGITPLKALLALRDHAGSFRGLDEDLRRSIADYFEYCIAPVLDLNANSPTAATRNTAKNFSEAFTSNNYWQMLAPVDASSTGSMILTLSIPPYSTVTCSTAHQTIASSLNSESMSIAANAIYQTHKWGSDETSKNEFMSSVNDTLVSMDPAVVTATANKIAENLVAFDIINGMCGDSSDLTPTYIAQCRMQSDAVHKRRLEEATKANGFLEMIVPLTTFVEGFVYMITPLMAVMVAFFGAGAMKMLGKYAMGLAWLAIMPICQVAVDLYLAVYFNKFLGGFGVDDEFGSVSFVNAQWLELESFISFAGTAQAMVPSLAMFILFGGIHAMQGLAGSASAGLKPDTSVLHGNQAIGMKDFQATAGNTKVTSAGDGSGNMAIQRMSTAGVDVSSQSYSIKESASLNRAKQEVNQEVSQASQGWTAQATEASQYALKNGLTINDTQAKILNMSKDDQIAHNNAVKANEAKQKAIQVGQTAENNASSESAAGGNVKVTVDDNAKTAFATSAFFTANATLGPVGGATVAAIATTTDIDPSLQAGQTIKESDVSKKSTNDTLTDTNALLTENGETSVTGYRASDGATLNKQRTETEDKTQTFNDMLSRTAEKKEAYQQAISKQESLQAAIANAQDSSIEFSAKQMIDAQRNISDKGAYKVAETVQDGIKDLATRMSEDGFTSDEGKVLSQLGVDVDHLKETGFVKFDDSVMQGEYKEGDHDKRAIDVSKLFSQDKFSDGSINMLKFDGMNKSEIGNLSTQEHREEFAAELLDTLMNISNQGFKGLENNGGTDDYIAADVLEFSGNVFEGLGNIDYGGVSTGGGKHQGMIEWGEAQQELARTLREVDADSTLREVDVSNVNEGPVLSKEDEERLSSNRLEMARDAINNLVESTPFESLEDQKYFTDYVQSKVGTEDFDKMIRDGKVNLVRDGDGNIVGFDVGNLAKDFHEKRENFDLASFDAEFAQRRQDVVDKLNGGLSGAVLWMAGHDTAIFDPRNRAVDEHARLLRNDATWQKADQLSSLENQNLDAHKAIRSEFMKFEVDPNNMSHWGGGATEITEHYKKKAENFDRLAAKAMATGDYTELEADLRSKGIDGDKLENLLKSSRDLSAFTKSNEDLMSTLVIAQGLKDDGYNSQSGELKEAVKEQRAENLLDDSVFGSSIKAAKELMGSY